MYFSSTCPHCQKMMATLAALQARGFFVEARQIDRENGLVRTLPYPVEFASSEEVKQKDIQSVPLLLVGDLKRKVIYRLTGYQGVPDVLNALQKEAGNNGRG